MTQDHGSWAPLCYQGPTVQHAGPQPILSVTGVPTRAGLSRPST